MFVICLHTKFHTPVSSCSLLIAIQFVNINSCIRHIVLKVKVMVKLPLCLTNYQTAQNRDGSVV
jgi:hypothetical protein